MESKSSTFLALTSILAILAVLSVAINNVESSPLRRPFPTSAATLNGSTPKKTDFENVIGAKADGIKTSLNKPGTLLSSDSVKDLNTEKTGINFDQRKDLALKTTLPPLASVDNSLNKGNVVQNTKTATIEKVAGDELNQNISSELLGKVGFKNFIIRSKPFEGTLFGKFDLSMISSLNIVKKDIVETRQGNEIPILSAVEFRLADADTTSEIYNLLKAKIKGDLDVSINQNNQFGMGSFYVNFNETQTNVFLVVKTKTNVYALSYPKLAYDVDGQEENYADLTAKLLKELN